MNIVLRSDSIVLSLAYDIDTFFKGNSIYTMSFDEIFDAIKKKQRSVSWMKEAIKAGRLSKWLFSIEHVDSGLDYDIGIDQKKNCFYVVSTRDREYNYHRSYKTIESAMRYTLKRILKQIV